MEQFIEKWLQKKSSFLGFQSLRLGIRIRRIFAVMSLPFQSRSRPLGNKIWLAGDPLCISEIFTKLEHAGKTIVKDPRNADRIVFCEGHEYSFHEIIGKCGAQ